MPKYALAVIRMPATATSTYPRAGMWSGVTSRPKTSFATGIANMARPTPNQPIWVKDIMALGSQLPFLPKLLWESMSRVRPLLAPI